MSDLATRPLTFITPAMYRAAQQTYGGIWRQLSRCGRYYVYQARTPVYAPEAVQLVAAGWRMVADVEDLDAYAAAYGGDLAAAGRAIVTAANS